MRSFFLLSEIFTLFGMLAFAFCILLPKALNFYTLWKNTHKNRDFSLFVNCLIWSFFFIAFAYANAMKASLKIESYFSTGIEKLIISLILTMISVCFLTPKALHFFQKWRKLKKERFFCLSAFLVFVEFYFMSYIYLIYVRTDALKIAGLAHQKLVSSFSTNFLTYTK